MGILSFLGVTESRTVTEAHARAAAAENSLEMVRESVADLELAMEDSGWDRVLMRADQEFSRAGLDRAAKVARVMAVKHPLIKRGLGVRQAYVWGQGVQVQARATGNGGDGEQDVNAVVQAFLDDEGNRAAFAGDQAQEENERALGTDGNFFLACFTSPMTGFVQVRSIPFDEIQDIICNPDDRDDPWFYERQWTETVVDIATATTRTQMRTAYYPALTYRPRVKVKTINGYEVHWDSPVKHVSVNRLDGWKFGIGDAYAAIDDARLYRDFLTDWAVLVKALSQFAWRASAKGSRAQRLRQALTRRPAGTAPEGNPNNVGSTFTAPDDVTLEAIPKSGATIDSESGRPLAAMIAAALDVPVTTLLADPGATGARAVAETLEFPTRLAMQQRQSLWAEVYRSVLAYAIREAVRAPQGPLKGTITRDRFTGREVLVLAGDTDTTVEVEFPSLDQLPMKTVIDAIVAADSTGKMPAVETVKMLLRALGAKDVDELVANMLDDQGRFIDPLASAGQAAVDAFRRGENPAAVA